MPGDAPPPLDRDARARAARGAVRDALSAVRNLSQLLRSVRVGPKALAAVIPDVHAACQPMIRSTEQLLDSESPLGDPECRRLLLDYLRPRMQALEAALSNANRGAFRASQRLALEKVSAQVVPELDGALGLVDFLLEAVEDRRVTVDVREMAKESATILEGTHLPNASLQVALGPADSPTPVNVNARATMALLTLCVSLVADGTTGPVAIHVRAMPERCELRVARSTNTADTFRFIVPVCLEPSGACAASLARAAGLEFTRSDDSVLLSLPLGRT